MASNVTWRQYCATLDTETDGLSPISVHQMQTMERNVNILAHVLAPKLHFLFMPRVSSADGTTDEHIVAVFAPVMVPYAYDAYTWTMQNYVVAARAVTWRLYCGPSMHICDSNGNFTTSTAYSISTISTTSTTGWQRNTNKLVDLKTSGGDPTKAGPNSKRLAYFVLTAEGSATSHDCDVGVLDITMKIKDAAA